MIFIFGPYASGKKEYVQTRYGYKPEDFTKQLGTTNPVIYDVQNLAALAGDVEELARQLQGKEVVIAVETGCGVVPIEKDKRQAREAAGQLNALLALQAQQVIRIWWGIPEQLK